MFCEYVSGEVLQKTPPLKFVNPLIPFLYDDIRIVFEQT